MQRVHGMRSLVGQSCGFYFLLILLHQGCMLATVYLFRRFADIDESEVTSPISIADWLRDFYPIAVKHPSCIRGVCHAGEVIFIPSGNATLLNSSNLRMVASRC